MEARKRPPKQIHAQSSSEAKALPSRRANEALERPLGDADRTNHRIVMLDRKRLAAAARYWTPLRRWMFPTYSTRRGPVRPRRSVGANREVSAPYGTTRQRSTGPASWRIPSATNSEPQRIRSDNFHSAFSRSARLRHSVDAPWADPTLANDLVHVEAVTLRLQRARRGLIEHGSYSVTTGVLQDLKSSAVERVYCVASPKPLRRSHRPKVTFARN